MVYGLRETDFSGPPSGDPFAREPPTKRLPRRNWLNYFDHSIQLSTDLKSEIRIQMFQATPNADAGASIQSDLRSQLSRNIATPKGSHSSCFWFNSIKPLPGFYSKNVSCWTFNFVLGRHSISLQIYISIYLYIHVLLVRFSALLFYCIPLFGFQSRSLYLGYPHLTDENECFLK